MSDDTEKFFTDGEDELPQDEPQSSGSNLSQSSGDESSLTQDLFDEGISRAARRIRGEGGAVPGGRAPKPTTPTTGANTAGKAGDAAKGAGNAGQVAKGVGKAAEAGEVAAEAVNAAGEVAESVGAAAAGAAGEAAGKAVAAGGTAVSVGATAVEAGQAIADGDAVGAGEAAVRAAAVAATSAVATPLAGAAVDVVLRTKVGRKTTRGVVYLIIAALTVIVMLFAAAVMTATNVVATFLAAGAGQVACVAPNGGGIPVSGASEQQVAADIISEAYSRGLGQQGAVIGVMTAITESSLDPTARDALQTSSTPAPLLSVGVFQQMPFYWANEFWPTGTKVGDANFNNPTYLTQARNAIYQTPYAAGKFYDKFNTISTLSGGKWKKMTPWMVAQTIQKSAFPDGSNYASNLAIAESTVVTVIANNPGLTGSTSSAGSSAGASTDPSASATDSGPCPGGGVYGGFGDYTIPGGSANFTDGPIIYKNTAKAISRALSAVGRAGVACSDGMCFRLCDHLAGWVWGYDASGYNTAKEHWGWSLAHGIAHPGNTQPPIGALLFWDTGPDGHVATYIGNGYVVSNLTGGPMGNNVYKVPANSFKAPYLGWADPVFFNQAPGSGL